MRGVVWCQFGLEYHMLYVGLIRFDLWFFVTHLQLPEITLQFQIYVANLRSLKT